jgi:hypothetical protein
MVDFMPDKHKVVEILRKQYMNSKYGKLHQALLKNGIETELYIGIGIEMYYSDAYNPSFIMHVFDEDNLVIIDKRECADKHLIEKAFEITKSLGYRVKDFDEITEEEIELYFG